VDFVTFGFVLLYARACFTEFLFVKTLSETFAGLFNLFFDLFVLFGDKLFDQYVCTVTFFRVTVINQWIVESTDVT